MISEGCVNSEIIYLNISFIGNSKPAGLLSFLTSWRRNSNGKKNYGKNLFLDPRMHNDYEDGFEMHQFSDSGRIANRYDNMRWDVW